MASPHVAGAAALIWARGSQVTNQAVRGQLEATADTHRGHRVRLGKGTHQRVPGAQRTGVLRRPAPSDQGGELVARLAVVDLEFLDARRGAALREELGQDALHELVGGGLRLPHLEHEPAGGGWARGVREIRSLGSVSVLMCACSASYWAWVTTASSIRKP